MEKEIPQHSLGLAKVTARWPDGKPWLCSLMMGKPFFYRSYRTFFNTEFWKLCEKFGGHNHSGAFLCSCFTY